MSGQLGTLERNTYHFSRLGRRLLAGSTDGETQPRPSKLAHAFAEDRQKSRTISTPSGRNEIAVPCLAQYRQQLGDASRT